MEPEKLACDAVYRNRKRIEIFSRTHDVTTDQPLEKGGDDLGMTPPELFLSALAACATHYAVEYLRTRDLSTDGVRAHVSAQKLGGPARLDNFLIEISTPELDARFLPGLMRAVEACLLHRTLASVPKFEFRMSEQNALATLG
jgi:uncharacterized OsmC-like protein